MMSEINTGKRKGTLESFIIKKSRPSASDNGATSDKVDNVNINNVKISENETTCTSTMSAAVTEHNNVSGLNINDISEVLSMPKSNIDNNVKYMILNQDSIHLESFKFPSKKEGIKSRCCQLSWLKQYKWAVYSKNIDGIFCKHCFLFGKSTSHNSTISTLVTQPLTKWKKALEVFKNHEKKHLSSK